MTKKRILFLNRGTVLYGAETRMIDILRHLNRDEFEGVAVLPKPGPFADVLRQMGIEVITVDFDLGLRPSIFQIFKLNQAIGEVIRQHKIDILHFNMHYGIAFLWPTLIRMHRRTVVHLRSHSWIYPFERFLIYRCGRIISISEYIKASFLQRRRSDLLTFIRKEKIETIYDGIDVETFRPLDTPRTLRTELKIGADQKIVAVIGALHIIKGQDLVVEAIPQIIAEHPQTKFLFIGGPYLENELSMAYERKLKDRIAQLNIGGHVMFIGARQDIPQVMNEIDILLQPSQREALGTSMIEAMACGKPVIGTAVDGIPEVIGADESGFLLDPRTPEQLAKLVNRLLSSAEIAARKGQDGRRRAETLFNIRKTIKNLETIYRDLAA